MTFNPGMMGFDPQQMQAAHEIGKHIRLEVRKYPREGRLEIRYVAVNPGDVRSQATIANCVEGLAMQMALIHDTIFGMKGKIIQEG
jgi:hypothetical protein